MFRPCVVDTRDLCGPDGDDLQSNGRDVRASVIGDGLIRNIKTITDGGGLSSEIEISGRVFGLDHVARTGASYEQASAHFRSSSQLGRLARIRGGLTVTQLGMALDGEEWNKDLDVETRNFGIYAVDTVSLTPGLSAQFSGRWNRDQIDLVDRLGGDLSGKHSYARFNPSLGLTWRRPDVILFASYGESSRNPTAAELSCSDEDEPCLFPLSFVSDPDLKQVVARTGELRVDGQRTMLGGNLAWSAAIYDTRTRDDILFVSSGAFIGQGYFTNVGATRRRGGEASAKLAWEPFDIGLQFAVIEATYRSAFRVQAADNPGADADGAIFVKPGDRIPNIPSQTGKLGFGWNATPDLRLELNTSFVSGQHLRGDEANLQPKLKGYTRTDIGAEYRFSDAVTAYLEVENVFDRRYATFGAYSDPTAGGALPQFSDPRFVSPGQPRAFWIGIRTAL
jgi:outer membrane receptor protein involved in Fe transport